MSAIVLFQAGVDALRAVEIFLIPPAGDVHDGHLDGVEIRREGQALPEGIVVGVAGEILPGGELAVEVLFVGVRKRAEGEIPIVSVGAVEGEMVILFGGGFEQGGVFETVTEAESAVVMEIVAEELVGGGSLLDEIGRA